MGRHKKNNIEPRDEIKYDNWFNSIEVVPTKEQHDLIMYLKKVSGEIYAYTYEYIIDWYDDSKKWNRKHKGWFYGVSRIVHKFETNQIQHIVTRDMFLKYGRKTFMRVINDATSDAWTHKDDEDFHPSWYNAMKDLKDSSIYLSSKVFNEDTGYSYSIDIDKMTFNTKELGSLEILKTPENIKKFDNIRLMWYVINFRLNVLVDEDGNYRYFIKFLSTLTKPMKKKHLVELSDEETGEVGSKRKRGRKTKAEKENEEMEVSPEEYGIMIIDKGDNCV